MHALAAAQARADPQRAQRLARRAAQALDVAPGAPDAGTTPSPRRSSAVAAERLGLRRPRAAARRSPRASGRRNTSAPSRRPASRRRRSSGPALAARPPEPASGRRSRPRATRPARGRAPRRAPRARSASPRRRAGAEEVVEVLLAEARASLALLDVGLGERGHELRLVRDHRRDALQQPVAQVADRRRRSRSDAPRPPSARPGRRSGTRRAARPARRACARSGASTRGRRPSSGRPISSVTR